MARVVVVDADPVPAVFDEVFGGDGEHGVWVDESGDNGGSANAEVAEGVFKGSDAAGGFDDGVDFAREVGFEPHFPGEFTLFIAVFHDEDRAAVALGEIGDGDAKHAHPGDEDSAGVSRDVFETCFGGGPGTTKGAGERVVEVGRDGEDGGSGAKDDVRGVGAGEILLAVAVFEEGVALLGKIVVGAIGTASAGVDDGPDDAGARFEVAAGGFDDAADAFVTEGDGDGGFAGSSVSPEVRAADCGRFNLDKGLVGFKLFQGEGDFFHLQAKLWPIEESCATVCHEFLFLIMSGGCSMRLTATLSPCQSGFYLRRH